MGLSKIVLVTKTCILVEPMRPGPQHAIDHNSLRDPEGSSKKYKQGGGLVQEKELLARRRRLIGSRLDLLQRMGLRNLKTWEGLPDYSWEDPPLNTSTIPFAW